MIRRKLLILGLLILTSCQQHGNLTDTEKEAVTRNVRQMLDNYFADIKTDGLTAEFKYLDQSPEFFWVPPGFSSPLSYDSVRTILTMTARAYESIDFKWDALRIYPLGNELANYTGRVKGTMVDTAGTSTQVGLIETGIIIKRDDGWKLLSGQSSVLPVDSQHNE